jgi:hypothetical protein
VQTTVTHLNRQNSVAIGNVTNSILYTPRFAMLRIATLRGKARYARLSVIF